MGRARSASDLFKMLNPNTCVFRDFGRRGSQSQGKAKKQGHLYELGILSTTIFSVHSPFLLIFALKVAFG